MPPWAAMECARRGESWKQKQSTLYPNSPRLAAADPPARPEPTTMILNLRLFAGLTSFRPNLCVSHDFSIGPVGVLETSSILSASPHTGLMKPANTATGIEMLPAAIKIATTLAAPRSHGVYTGWLNPSD